MAQGDVEQAAELAAVFDDLNSQISRVIIGQQEVLFEILIGLVAGGHCLLTGVPGLAKTLMVSTISKALDLEFSRIQFTPDLMPSDITGTEIIDDEPGDGRSFRFVRGPVFAQVILADEINRTPPKTQAALLQAMQEGQVTAGGKTHDLPRPFYVLATQNPIEQEGTYPLPEAQLDRFMLNVLVGYPDADEENEIVATTTSAPPEDPEPVAGAEQITKYQELVRRVPVPESVLNTTVELCRSTRPGDSAPEYINRWVSWGVGPRAAQHLVLAAKGGALLQKRNAVTIDDIERLAIPVLRHRLVLNFSAEAEGITPDDVLKEVTETALA
ncbi:MAG: MoxR family ATPase [Candidatus Coatesbacteria bacterium]|nr:MAG: MoxR family ATPase [Candidatus Coatesbacteria bacterium]